MRPALPRSAVLTAGAPTGTSPSEPTDLDGAVPPVRSLARRTAQALVLFFAIRVVSFLSCLAFLHGHRIPLRRLVTAWDGEWYLQIAAHGYHAPPDTSVSDTWSYGFYPLFSLLTGAVRLLPLVSTRMAGLGVAGVAALAAAAGIYRVAEHVRDHRTGLVTVGLWAVAPSSVVVNLPYADGMFVAFAAWSLWALLRGRWVWAGVLCVLAGLTRPAASALCLAVLVAAIGQVWTARRQREPIPRAPILAVLIAPLGLLSWWAYVGIKLHRVDGYTWMQHTTWHNEFDGGHNMWRAARAMVDGVPVTYAFVFQLAVAVAFLFPLLVWSQVVQRQAAALVAYSVGMGALPLFFEHFFWTTPRELLPAFPALLPIASVLARRRWPTALVGLAFLAVLCGWYGWFMPVLSGYAP